MSIIHLKDVKVTRLNQSGFGFTCLEESVSKGKTYKTFWKVWPDSAPNVGVGDVISLSGFLSAKIGDPWKDRDGNERTSVELSVNGVRMGGSETAPSAPVISPPASEPEPWASAGPTGYDAETPF